MLFYFNGEGKIIKTIPKPIYQGSNKANTIYFIAPVTATAKVNVSFILPNGFITKQNTMVAQGQLSGIEAPDNSMFNVWSFDIPAIVTAYAGAVTTQFFIIADKSIITTQTVKFAVSKGVSPILPKAPTENVYTEILLALQNISERAYSNTTGTMGLEYTIKNDNTASVVGYSGESTNIIIPEWYINDGIYYPVTRIGTAFPEFPQIESIIIPESVEYIGAAFVNQQALTSIVIPKNVIRLNGTFKNCYNLEQIIFEGAVPLIMGINTFEETSNNVEKGLKIFVKPQYYKQFIEYDKLNLFKIVTTLTTEELEEFREEIEDSVNSSFSALNQAIQTEASTRASEDTKLQSNIDAEASARATVVNELLALITALQTAGYITKEVSNLINYYKKDETYSKAEIDELYEVLAGLGIEFEVVQTLPTTGNNKTIYLLSAKDSQEQDIYEEYIYIRGAWERIGSTAVNLANYYTKSQIDALLKNYAPKHWEGTRQEFEEAQDSIAVGTICIITESNGDVTIETKTAILGKAVLGQMILGKGE